MSTTVFAIFTLEAAHRLEHVPETHKCRRLHGHTYEVRIEVSGPLDETLGWVVDYAAIEEAWRSRIFDKLDHRYINDALATELRGNTTSELLAAWMRKQIVAHFGCERSHVVVEVWETATCGARVSG